MNDNERDCLVVYSLTKGIPCLLFRQMHWIIRQSKPVNTACWKTQNHAKLVGKSFTVTQHSECRAQRKRTRPTLAGLGYVFLFSHRQTHNVTCLAFTR